MPPKAPILQMHKYEDRLATFEPIAKPKARARHGWPLDPQTHPRLTPADMASAGFYYSPGGSEASADNCVCFLCGVQLGGWAEDDDPYKEHVERGNCAWAETICQVVLDRANNVTREYTTQEDLPSSATYSYVRENTYYSKDRETCWWPHIKNKKHQVTPQNLARAGFVFTPSKGSEDAVKCPLCEYDVEEWDEDDDPMEQHRRKYPDCLFFTAQVTKGKAKRAPRITKKTKAISDIEVEAEAEEPTESAPRPTTSRSRTRNTTSEIPSESQPSTSTSTRTRAKKGKKPEVEAVDEDDEVIIVDDDDEIEVEEEKEKPVVAVKKSTRGGRKGKQVANDQEEEVVISTDSQSSRSKNKGKKVEPEPAPEPVEGEEVDEEIESVPAPKMKTTSTSTKSNSSSSSSSKTISKSSKSKSSRKPVPVDDQDEGPTEIEAKASEHEPAVEEATTKKVVKPRTTKASKSKSQSKTTATAKAKSEEENLAGVVTSSGSASTMTITTTSKSAKPLPPLPPPSPTPVGRPLSQLDRFANIPPSSPVSAPVPAPVPRLTKPIPKKTTSTSQPTRKPLALPTPIPNTISSQTKSIAQEVIKSALPLPLQSDSPNPSPILMNGLTEEQLRMTMENWIKNEMMIKREEIEREGRDMIGAFEARTREARRKIEGLPTRS